METLFVDSVTVLQKANGHLDSIVYDLLKLLVLSLASAAVIGYVYLTKRFDDQITYGGNAFVQKPEGGHTLVLRTLDVIPRQDLLPSNLFFRFKLFLAIRRCTVNDPFVRMASRDMDVLQPAIINGLSRMFADGIAAMLAGKPVETQAYYLAVTCEQYGDIPSKKLRVIIITEEEMRKACDPEVINASLTFERAHHRNRMTTLIQMAHLFQKEQSLPEGEVRIVRATTGYTRT